MPRRYAPASRRRPARATTVTAPDQVATSTTDAVERDVASVRAFTRFYTRIIGVLQEGLLETPFSLAESRVLYELAHSDAPTAAALRDTLGMDAGYLSRILQGLERRRLVARVASPTDARARHITLSAAGRRAFAKLDARSHDEVAALLSHLDDAGRTRLVNALGTARRLLGDEQQRTTHGPPYLIRPPRAGDMGWVVHRHGALYAREYGWDGRFEALVARVVADFVDHFDPARERCWIAEREGEIVGSVFLAKKSATVGKLRLLYVEPSARGLGIGRQLVRECLAFARDIGCRKVTLWTNAVLHAARAIYVAEGFTLVSEEPHALFGPDEVGQTWELTL